MLLNWSAGEDSWESLRLQEIKPINPKGNQPWIFIGRTDAEAEVPILGPPDEKSWLTGKDPDAGKDWRQQEKGTTEDDMVGWHHWLNGNELEQALGDGEEQRSLVYCSPWGHKPTRLLSPWNSPGRLPFPTPGDLLDSGIEPVSRALAGEFITTVPPGKPGYQGTATITPKSTVLVI